LFVGRFENYSEFLDCKIIDFVKFLPFSNFKNIKNLLGLMIVLQSLKLLISKNDH